MRKEGRKGDGKSPEGNELGDEIHGSSQVYFPSGRGGCMEGVWPAQNLWESAQAEDLKVELQFQRWKDGKTRKC